MIYKIFHTWLFEDYRSPRLDWDFYQGASVVTTFSHVLGEMAIALDEELTKRN